MNNSVGVGLYGTLLYATIGPIEKIHSKGYVEFDLVNFGSEAKWYDALKNSRFVTELVVQGIAAVRTIADDDPIWEKKTLEHNFTLDSAFVVPHFEKPVVTVNQDNTAAIKLKVTNDLLVAAEVGVKLYKGNGNGFQKNVWSNLEYLDFSGTAIEEWDEDAESLPKLKKITLSNCTKMKRLEYSGDDASKFVAELDGCTALTYLYLWYCDISDFIIPSNVTMKFRKCFGTLEAKDLSSTSLNVEDGHYESIILKNDDLSNLYFESFTEGQPISKKLVIENLTLPQNYLTIEDVAEDISISGISFSSLNVYTSTSVKIANCPNLKSLTLKDTPKFALRAEDAPALTKLDIMGENRLMNELSLTGLFYNLERLLVKNQALTTINLPSSDFPALMYLNCMGNQITMLVPELFDYIRRSGGTIEYDKRYDYDYEWSSSPRGYNVYYTDLGVGFYYSGEPAQGYHYPAKENIISVRPR